MMFNKKMIIIGAMAALTIGLLGIQAPVQPQPAQAKDFVAFLDRNVELSCLDTYTIIESLDILLQKEDNQRFVTEALDLTPPVAIKNILEPIHIQADTKCLP